MPKYKLNPLEKLIRYSGLTQKDFAKKVGTTPGRLSALKNKNNIKLNEFEKWCKIFEFDVKEFF